MQASRWLAASLALALAVADSDLLVPGVRVLAARPQRQAIFFPGDPIFRPLSGPVNTSENLPPADGTLELPEDMDLNAVSRACEFVAVNNRRGLFLFSVRGQPTVPLGCLVRRPSLAAARRFCVW